MHNPDTAPTGTAATAEAAPNVEVWNDLVSPRDLLVCLFVSAACAVVSLVIAGATGSQPLFWSLGGCVLGFVISCLVVRPKREVLVIDDTVEHTSDDAAADSVTTSEGAAR